MRRTAFFSNPFRFTSAILGKTKSGRLECTHSEVEESIRQAHSDPGRTIPLGGPTYPKEEPVPETHFNLSDLRFEEIKKVVESTRS